MSGTIKYGIFKRDGVAGLTVWEAIADWAPSPDARAYARQSWVPMDHVILDGQVIEVHRSPSSWRVCFFRDASGSFNIALMHSSCPAPVTWGLSQEIAL